MAAIATRVAQTGCDAGQLRGQYFDITFDAAYATGGVAVTPALFGLVGLIAGISFEGQRLVAGTARTTSYRPEYDPATGKIQFFGQNGSTGGDSEMANATALATVQLRARVMGI